MVVYIEMDGNVKILSPENLYQGSTTNRVTLITPFPSTTAVGVGFILPDGTTVTDSSGANYFPMELLNTETSAGVTATAYEYVLPFTVLEQYGELKIAFKATFTNGNQTSYLAAVEVQESVLPTPPENPDEDTYQLLLQYIQTAMQNAANAQSAAEAAQTAAESAETKAAAAETTAGQANETANEAKTTADGIDGKATQALTNSEQAVTTANEAKTTADGIDGKATQALTNSEQAVTTANEAKELAEQAVAGAGTEVYVNNALQSRLDFTSDPQTQINDKQNQINNIESGVTKVGSAAQADKLSTARNLKVDLASGEAQSFDGSANAEDIGVGGVLPIANGGTGASDLDSVKVGEAGSADEATKLATARNMQVNLASGNQQSFDGSEDATEIGVKGILPVGNGGTGTNNLDNVFIRTNGLQSLSDTQKNYAKYNVAVAVDGGRTTTGTIGWYNVAKWKYSDTTYTILMTIVQTHYAQGYQNIKLLINTSDENNFVITQLSGTLGSTSATQLDKVRIRIVDDIAYIDIHQQSAVFNRNTIYFEDLQSEESRNNSTYFLQAVDFELVSSDTGVIKELSLVAGFATTGDIYSNGSPVLVGAPPAWVTGTSGSLTLPSAGWYIFRDNSSTRYQDNSGIVYFPGNNDKMYRYPTGNSYYVVENGNLRTFSTSGSIPVAYYKLA